MDTKDDIVETKDVGKKAKVLKSILKVNSSSQSSIGSSISQRELQNSTIPMSRYPPLMSQVSVDKDMSDQSVKSRSSSSSAAYENPLGDVSCAKKKRRNKFTINQLVNLVPSNMSSDFLDEASKETGPERLDSPWEVLNHHLAKTGRILTSMNKEFLSLKIDGIESVEPWLRANMKLLKKLDERHKVLEEMERSLRRERAKLANLNNDLADLSPHERQNAYSVAKLGLNTETKDLSPDIGSCEKIHQKNAADVAVTSGSEAETNTRSENMEDSNSSVNIVNPVWTFKKEARLKMLTRKFLKHEDKSWTSLDRIMFLELETLEEEKRIVNENTIAAVEPTPIPTKKTRANASAKVRESSESKGKDKAGVDPQSSSSGRRKSGSVVEMHSRRSRSGSIVEKFFRQFSPA